MNENKELSLRGAAGDVAISRVKASSSRGRAESSDVAISCDKVLSFLRLRGASGAQGIFAPARVLFKHLSCRFLFILIRKSPEFFRILRKNRDDHFYFGFAKVTALAFIFTFITTAESWAGCPNGYELHSGRCIITCGRKYTGCIECYYDNDENPTGCKAYACRYKYRYCNECSYDEDGSGPIACIECDSSGEAYLKDGDCVPCPSMPGTCYWDEEQGKAIMTGCTSGYILCGERCRYPQANHAKSSHCDEATGNLVVDECMDGYKVKNGTCLSSSASCGDGYVDGDGVCYKIPDGCESASATDGSCTKCSAGLSFDDDNNCIECNKEGYKNLDGYCYRVRYTLPEADEATSNDNENMIEWIFE